MGHLGQGLQRTLLRRFWLRLGLRLETPHFMHSKRIHMQTSHQEASFLFFRLRFPRNVQILQDPTNHEQFAAKPDRSIYMILTVALLFCQYIAAWHVNTPAACPEINPTGRPEPGRAPPVVSSAFASVEGRTPRARCGACADVEAGATW